MAECKFKIGENSRFSPESASSILLAAKRSVPRTLPEQSNV
jgi:hypothetical protein